MSESARTSARAQEFSGFVRAQDGTQLYVSDRGAGAQTLVLCDGIGCAGFAWQNLAELWVQNYRVVHWHYRGHGRSEVPRDPARITVEDLAQDLREVLHARKISSAVLVAHSLGTQVALELYRQAPELVQGFVMICGTAGNITKTFHGSDWLDRVIPEARAWLLELPELSRTLWRMLPSSVIYYASKQLHELDTTRITPAQFAVYWEHIKRLDPDLFTRMLHEASKHDAAAILETIDCPTLVFCAEKDTFVPARVVQEMAKSIAHAVVVQGAGASHAFPVEQPELIDEYVRQIFTPVAADSVEKDSREAAAPARNTSKDASASERAPASRKSEGVIYS